VKLLTVDTIEQAREKLADRVKSWTLKTDMVPVDKAPGCILAEDIFSPCSIPSYRRSTVDGYAVLACDTSGAGEGIPVILKLTGSVLIGRQADIKVSSGECVYVPTGGMLPQGADAMVMLEYSEAAGAYLSVYKSVAPGAGIIEEGEDFQKGKLLLKKGTCIRAQETGALSAAGILNVSVYASLSLAIISTGDELVSPEQEPAPGKIRDVNTSALKALAKRYGCNAAISQVLPDDEAVLENAVRSAMTACDIIIISGGSSKGDRDFTAKIIDSVSKPGVFTHGLAVKPGKPTILGWDDQNKKLFAGLPGHPVSAMMIFTTIFGWLSEILFNKQPAFPVPARISCNVPGAPGKTVFMPVVLELQGGFYLAKPVFGKAGIISTLTDADGYIIIERNKEGIKQDESVLVYLFQE